MVTRFDISQEIFLIDVLRALKSSLNDLSQACSVILTTMRRPGLNLNQLLSDNGGFLRNFG